MSLAETQYEQVAQEIRIYEIQMYLTPASLLAALGLAFQYSLARPDDWVKVALSAFLVMLCFTVTVLFAKQSIYQRSLRQALDKIETRQETLLRIPRTTGIIGDMPRLDRSIYTRNTPLWLYHRLSADKMVMWMLMSSVLGTLAYLVKTLVDVSRLDCSEGCKIIIAATSSIALFLIHCAVLSREEEHPNAKSKSR